MVVAAVILLLAAGIVFTVPAVSVLSLSNRKNSKQRYYSREAFLNGFEISYTHSVNKGRVHDKYKKTEDNQLELNSTVFVSYGAGIPEPGETPGAKFIVRDDGYEITELHRVVPKLTMAVGIIANHGFLINGSNGGTGQYYTMTDLFKAQTSIILEIKRISFLEYIFHKL